MNASITALQEKLRALGPAAPSQAQRKLVTVVFADVSGFTALAETMDAEDVSEMMNAVWDRLDYVITRHGGRIDKHIGDAVMALWGAEAGREDDPERAIRAALEMQCELLRLGNGGERDGGGRTLTMRIGIHTGPVLLSEVGSTSEYTAIGDTVNTASRLEHVAPLAGVLISHAVYRHVRGLFEVESLSPIHVRGKAKPVVTYLVKRAVPRGFQRVSRGVEGVETKMVGRDAELRGLQDLLSGVLGGGDRVVVTLCGEAGVGKSRLLAEFVDWIDALEKPPRTCSGRASQESRTQPFALLRDLVWRMCAIQDGDTAEETGRKLQGRVAELLGERGDSCPGAGVIGRLLGLDAGAGRGADEAAIDPEQLRDQGLRYLTDMFAASAARSPTLILLDDVHWADESSLEAVKQITSGVPRRLFVVFVGRPVLLEQHAGWGQDEPHHTLVKLSPLSQETSQQLVTEILRKAHHVPAELTELIVSRAAGNPFYVEELVKMLIDDAVIIPHDDHWSVEKGRLRLQRIPGTLAGVLQARRDGLPAGEQTLLGQASVVGQSFWEDALTHIGRASGAETDVGSVQTSLATLEQKEMVFARQSSSFAHTREYRFKHSILRDATYESVLKRKRRLYHGLVAEWLQEAAGDRVQEYLPVIAEHLESAGRAEEASRFFQRAGQHALTQYAVAEAAAHFTRALELVQESDHAARYTILLGREAALDARGERTEQKADLESLQRLADRLDTEARAEVALRWAQFTRVTAEYRSSQGWASKAVDLGRSAGAHGSEADGYLHWGRALWAQGKYDEAKTNLLKAAEIAAHALETDSESPREASDAPGDTAARLGRIRTESLLNLGNVALYQGAYGEADNYYGQALVLFREAGNRYGECKALNNLGLVCLTQGNHAGARDYYRQALDIARSTGSRQSEVMALINLGPVSRALGEYDQAEAYSAQALGLAREIGNRHQEGTSLIGLGDVALSRHDYAAARTLYAQALRVFTDIGYRQGEAHARLNVGNAVAWLGSVSEAHNLYEKALAMFREIGNRQGEGWALTALGSLHLTLGDHTIAREHVEEAVALARVLGEEPLEGHALNALGAILAETGALTEAADTYSQAAAIRRQTGQHRLAVESLCGVADAALQQGNLPGALAALDEVLTAIGDDGEAGEDQPLHVYVTAYTVLREAGDRRAGALIHKTHQMLQHRAAKIADQDARTTFLEKMPVHREIVREYERLRNDT